MAYRRPKTVHGQQILGKGLGRTYHQRQYDICEILENCAPLTLWLPLNELWLLKVQYTIPTNSTISPK